MRCPGPDHDAPDRAPTPPAWLTGPLIHEEMLLHRAIAVGCRVVIHRTAAPNDRLGQDPTELEIEASLVRRME